jgi:hypothetical protein
MLISSSSIDLLAQSGGAKPKMQASEVPLAVAAAMSTASALELTVDDAIVLHDSNRRRDHIRVLEHTSSPSSVDQPVLLT